MNYIKRKLKKDDYHCTLVFHVELDQDNPNYYNNFAAYMAIHNGRMRSNIIIKDEITGDNLFVLTQHEEGLLNIKNHESVGFEESIIRYTSEDDHNVVFHYTDIPNPIIEIKSFYDNYFKVYKFIELTAKSFDIAGRKVKYIIEVELDVISYPKKMSKLMHDRYECLRFVTVTDEN